MKKSVLNTLTLFTLLAAALVWIYFLIVFANPQSEINLFAPPTLPAPITLPSFTPTLLRMPPTWTPGSAANPAGTVVLRPSSTLPVTATAVIRSTFTNTPTVTLTPTMTRTITNTATITFTPSRTPTPNLTATELSRIATSIAETDAAP